jgi:hypothetical protein
MQNLRAERTCGRVNTRACVCGPRPCGRAYAGRTQASIYMRATSVVKRKDGGDNEGEIEADGRTRKTTGGLDDGATKHTDSC